MGSKAKDPKRAPNQINFYISHSNLKVMKRLILLLCSATVLATYAQKIKSTDKKEDKHPYMDANTYSALKWRSVGPAVTSGRISDIVVNPNKNTQWYIAAASGGVWKTDNAGTSFNPIFEGQGSYSIGCLKMDPNNENTIWVGTGENNNQRSVAYGDGVYKSEDGGKTWNNMGLKSSEHIGMIAIDPNNSNIVYVAAYGPLWSKGGERGIYKSVDGGKTWKQTLMISENTGCNEVHIDPKHPNILYATAHQRRRHEWTYISGGPESAIYKSTDYGETWNKLSNGLPSKDMGRVSLAISPVNTDYIYAIIEATDDEKGFYRSTDRGASWEKRSGHSTAGNYYCEIFADPIDINKVYSMDTWAMVTEDGGKNFKGVGEKYKHVDNHSIWINPSNTEHMLMGCDGGLYETFDGAKNWDYKSNLSITQFYRVAVDNASPFYNIYGGTQDNNTLGGPSRTKSATGITNADWFVTVGGDGFEPAIDPTNPDIVYSQWQYGGLVRFDKKTGEAIDIKPQEREGEAAYRFNWDAPLLISKHNNKRLYFAANKVFKSDDQGNTWTVISEDLSSGIDRNKLKVMDKVWSMDAVAKNQSTSLYGNITALAESPLNEKVLYAGTDDGLIHVTTDGGATWTKVSSFTGVPAITPGVYVANIIASKHDENVAFVTFNNHRNGDFKPYIIKTIDKGKSWSVNITGDLPERGSAWCIAEDPKVKDLLFAGTEFGMYFTNNGGKNWMKLGSGLPTICIKDIAIQERENDLVVATFGRGFYVLDDYTLLQNIKQADLDEKAHIFPIKDGIVFIPSTPYGHKGKSFQGESFFTTPNPLIGANITYYLKDDYKTLKEIRQENEKERIKNNLPVYYPSADSLRLEDNEEAPYILAIITDENGNEIRRIKKSASKGMVRFTWNGRLEKTSPISFYTPNPDNPYEGEDNGPMAIPGTYKVYLSKVVNGVTEKLTEPVSFKIKSIYEPSLQVDLNDLAAFNKKLSETRRVVLASAYYLGGLKDKMGYIKEAVKNTPNAPASLLTDVKNIEASIEQLNTTFNGDGSLAKREFETLPGLTGMLENIVWNLWGTSVQQTTTYETKLMEVEKKFNTAYDILKKIDQQILDIEKKLEDMGAPYTPNRFPKK
jgi:photosystem II stability/assembly factor-like uncharacterized protein